MSAPGKLVSTLLKDIARVETKRDVRVQELAIDSRRVTPGTLFLALPGEQSDGRAFIADAIARGAAAVVHEAGGVTLAAHTVPAFAVAQLGSHVGTIAARFFDAPSESLIVIGVTGTNGKTTCTQLLAQAINGDRISEPTPPLPPGEGWGEGRGSTEIPHPHSLSRRERPLSRILRSATFARPAQQETSRGALDARTSFDRRCAVVGTLGYGFPGALAPASHTTPEAVSLQRLLAKFRVAGARYVAMEVSSHALDQGRVNALRFAVAVFTNLSRDHLDYHGDMQRYAEAKTKLFLREELEAAVVNIDDAHGRTLIEQLSPRLPVLSYGRSRGDVHARTLECSRDGLRMLARTPQGEVEIEAPLLGEFNALNLLAVLATLLALGFDAGDAARRLNGVSPVPGRVERFAASERPLVVVDYAHTPDALEQALKALRAHTDGTLWCVFGCGGNRDKGKRPQMGEIAERLADRVILTDDNPRHESGDAIIVDIAAGMKQTPRVIRERKRAIAAAIAEAGSDDVVLVAGKGHEDYQQVGDVRHAYSDRDTVRSLLGLAA